MSALAAAETDELKALYQDIILEHSRHPRNSRLIVSPTCSAHGNNPLCGDKVTVTAILGADGRLRDVAAEGKGCAISMASASMMTEALRGLTISDAHRLFDAVQSLCTGKMDTETAKGAAPAVSADHIEKLAALSGVKQFPVRVKCATLPWHTMLSCVSSGRADGAQMGENVKS